MNAMTGKHARIHRMVMDEHVCPYGTKALDLLRRRGYTVDDQWLTTRAQTDAFKAEHDVKTRRRCSSAASASAATTTCAGTSV